MAATTELNTLHRTVDELRMALDSVRSRYGDVPAVRRLLGDIDRLDLDASELDDLTPAGGEARPQLQPIDDTPHDPALWADADDEGLGGYHR
jgi:hypothetical protein